jgi:hypothetical protein
LGLLESVGSLALRAKVGHTLPPEHKMTGIIREQPTSGRVIGVTVENKGRKLKIRAKKGVIIGTGGSTGNVNFRRIFDPDLRRSTTE